MRNPDGAHLRHGDHTPTLMAL